MTIYTKAWSKLTTPPHVVQHVLVSVVMFLIINNNNNNNNKVFYSKHSKSNNIGCDYTDRNENRTEILRGYSEHYRVPII